MNNLLYHILPIWPHFLVNTPHVSHYFLCVSSSFWVDMARINDVFHGTIFPTKFTQNVPRIAPLGSTVASAVVQPPLQPSQGPILVGWRLGCFKCALKWDTKAKKTLVWSMDVCSYKSLHEPTDLEERLHKRKPLWRPPIFSTSLLTMERAFKDLESQETSLLMSGSRFLRIVAWRFLRPSQLAASFLCT